MNAGGAPLLHVVFNMSAASGVRKALAAIGGAERVIGPPDNLSFGPIGPPDARSRESSIEQMSGFDFHGFG